MKMLPYPFNEIYVEPSAKERNLTRRVLSKLEGVPVVELDGDNPFHHQNAAANIGDSKRRLLIKDYRGEPLKPCPGTKGRLCCNYHIINMAVGCPLDCSYCILQNYLNSPFLILYANVDYFLERIDDALRSSPERLFRMGTGELTDSLALDSITGLSDVLVPFFAEKDNALLELKTKSAEVDNLLKLDHNGRTVVAWSLNPQTVIDSDEAYAASLSERFKAASLCQDAGYRLAFHFDPMVCYPGWEEDYKEVVETLFSRIRPRNIDWISMGGLRFSPEMKPIMRERFPRSLLPTGELVPCEDKKLRYFKPIRVEMYRKLVSWIRSHAPEVPLYLCMESPQVWKEVFGYSPFDTRNLIPIFNR